VALGQAALRGDRQARSPVEVVVTISAETLTGEVAMARRDGVTANEVGMFGDGTCVSAETARRLACDCGVVTLHEDATGQPLSVGRRTRTIPAAIARALAQRDPVCRFPGCTNRRFLDGHHLVHWVQGGETSIDNLARLCGHHHRFVHEHGYRVERRDGALVFLDPAGKPVLAEPPRVVRASRGWPTIRAAAVAGKVAIDASTGRCRWDGVRPDYEWIVDRAVHAQYRRPPV
jgi:hypothetical protein